MKTESTVMTISVGRICVAMNGLIAQLKERNSR